MSQFESQTSRFEDGGYYSDLDKYTKRNRSYNYSYIAGHAIPGSRHYAAVNQRTDAPVDRKSISVDQEFDTLSASNANSRPSFRHFKFSFMPGTAHYTTGKPGPYGWTKARQRAMDKEFRDAAQRTGDLHALRQAEDADIDRSDRPRSAISCSTGTIPGVNVFLPYGNRQASGLGYGAKHNDHYAYLSSSQRPRPSTRAYDRENDGVVLVPYDDKLRPYTAPAPARAAGKEVDERTLKLAVGTGYGNKHPGQYAYLHKY